MRRLLFLALALTGLASAVHGQEYRKSFGLEFGAGMGPAHMYLLKNPSSATEKALADKGQAVNDSYYPALTVSGVLRTGYRWETAVTAGVSWGRFEIIQYDTFGIDPQGKPRYNLSSGTPVGWKSLDPTWTLTIHERVCWTPRWKARMYSGFGLGMVFIDEPFVIPSVTPVGCRLGGEHIYGFVEAPLSTYGLLFHGGLGWKF